MWRFMRKSISENSETFENAYRLASKLCAVMTLFETLQIVAISVISGLFSEALSWLLIYRTDEYIKLKERIEQGSKKGAPRARACVSPAQQ